MTAPEEIERLKTKLEAGETLTPIETHLLLADSLEVIETLKKKISEIKETIASCKISPYYLVNQFHETFGAAIRTVPVLDIPERKLRVNLVEEETEEYGEAEKNDDLIEIADALGDIVYVCYGAAISHGIDLDEVLAEIQRSNMSKLGADGKPIVVAEGPKKGKISKGPNFFVPDIRKVLLEQGWVETS